MRLRKVRLGYGKLTEVMWGYVRLREATRDKARLLKLKWGYVKLRDTNGNTHTDRRTPKRKFSSKCAKNTQKLSLHQKIQVSSIFIVLFFLTEATVLVATRIHCFTPIQKLLIRNVQNVVQNIVLRGWQQPSMKLGWNVSFHLLVKSKKKWF